MKLRMHRVLSFLLICLSPCLTVAQISPDLEEHKSDFDFWIGEWDVYRNETDKIVGFSKITSILNGVVIREEYKAANGGYQGTSLNKYNTENGLWEQYWVDNGGLTLHIKGGLKEGAMVMENEDNRITWTLNKDGTLNQVWDQKQEVIWKTIFNGQYRKKAE